MIEPDTLMRYIRIFSDLSGQIRYASQKRVLVEVAFIKLCNPAMETRQDAILDRIRALERQMEEGLSAMPMPIPSYGEIPVSEGQQKKAEAPAPAPKALPEDVQAIVKNWHVIVNQLHPLIRTYLKDARLKALGENKLGIIAATSTGEDFLKEYRHVQEILAVIQKNTGKEVELLIASAETDPHTDVGAIDIEQVINMEIEIEE